MQHSKNQFWRKSKAWFYGRQVNKPYAFKAWKRRNPDECKRIEARFKQNEQKATE